MKNVLHICFDFPPRRTSGVYRPTGLIKYLPRLGWRPTVLTVDLRKGDLEDSTLLERIPAETQTVRTGHFNLTRWEEPVAKAARDAGALRPRVNGNNRSRLDAFLRSLGDFARSCIYFPDETVGWVPFGLAKAVQLNLRQSFDVIFTSSPPRSASVIGFFLKMFLGIPWVAEFRDPWYLSNRPIRRRLEQWLYRLIMHKADAVVVVTQGHAEELRDSHGISAEKISVIPNGFDEEDFDLKHRAIEKGVLPPGYIHLTHFGTVYPNLSGKFFEGLTELVRECPEARERIRVNIIGCPDEVVKRYARSDELRDIIRIHDFMPHENALAAMCSSDWLLLFLAHPEVARLCVLGKTYEYLRVGRPILAITYEGGIKTLIEEGRAGWVAHPEDTERMKQILRAILRDGKGPQPPVPARPEFVAQFRYDRLAGKLANVFDGVSSRGL